MYNGHCAYCGKQIELKDMQVDHAKPLKIGGEDEISNYMPSCRSCNHYKATLDVEGFRKYLSGIHKRLMRDSVAYQVAERFGIVKHMSDDVKFFFEEYGGYKMTNADRIRSMTDEELADLLDNIESNGISAVNNDYLFDCCNEKANCDKCYLEWLRSESEVGKDA